MSVEYRNIQALIDQSDWLKHRFREKVREMDDRLARLNALAPKTDEQLNADLPDRSGHQDNKEPFRG